MKRLLSIVILMTSIGIACGQTHITIDNPSTWSGEALRPYIGQTVIFDVPMIICGNANGSYTVSPWRRYQPESHGYIGSTDYQSTLRVNSSCMFGLEGVSGYHRCGEKIIGLKAKVESTSQMTMISGEWSGNTRDELQKALPELGEYRLLVCGFNVENYYMTLGSMGARSSAEKQAQRAKVSSALRQINADLYGLVELQQGNEAIAEIVSDLNKHLPGRNYQYFHDATSGTYQKVDYVYDANMVAPISDKPAETNVETQNRKKIMCFREIATGEKFNFSINHFKAMNTGDEARRVNEARAVIELYNSYSVNKLVRDKDLLVMGDLNCYAYTAPIKVFMDRSLIDLHRAFHADSSYSYMFNGYASYIDHAISNETLYRQVTGVAAYHINSDEDDRFNYQKSDDRTMFRCSDHDPVLVGLKLDSTLVYDPRPTINSIEILSGKEHKLIVKDAYQEGKASYYATYTIRGMLIEQQPITNSMQEISLPTASGMYLLYIYFNGEILPYKFIVP